MTYEPRVRDLIEQLQRCDPDDRVEFKLDLDRYEKDELADEGQVTVTRPLNRVYRRQHYTVLEG